MSAIGNKIALLSKYSFFGQQIIGSVLSEELANGDFQVTFAKAVTTNNLNKNYPSYLIFRKRDNEWKIIAESDFITDKNLAKKKIEIPPDAIKGDFDGDGEAESVWLVPPRINDEGIDCIGDCISYLQFSNKNIAPIKIDNCISGGLSNLGDLNRDGKDEIGLLPGWFTSCWRSYYVFTYKNGKWEHAVPPISTHCNQWEKGIKPIEIDLSTPGNVIVRYSEVTDSDIVIAEKSIVVN